MPKRKSKPSKGLEQPVAKKREIDLKQTNGTDSTPVVRSRGGTRSEASTPAVAKTPQIRIGGSAKKRANAAKAAKTSPKENGPARSSRTRTPSPEIPKKVLRSRTPVAASRTVSEKVPAARTPRTKTPVSVQKSLRSRTPRATTPVSISPSSVGERNTAQTHSASRLPIGQSAKARSSKAQTPAAAASGRAAARKTTTPLVVLRTVESKTSAKKAAPASAKKKAKLAPKKLPSSGGSKVTLKKSPRSSRSTKNSPAGSSKENTKMASEGESWKTAETVYSFTANNIQGEPVSLEKYKGNVLLIVNVASRCGLTTKNYAQLVELDEKYRDQGLRILAFPCNQFAGQEPGSSEQICTYAKKKNVNFDMFEKIDVNGDNAHPLWNFLKTKQPGTFGNLIKWNFTKFLVNKEGKPVDRFAPTTEPLSIVEKIEALLK